MRLPAFLRRASDQARGFVRRGAEWAGVQPVVTLSALPDVQELTWTGEKYPGGYGSTTIWDPDYWTLRTRSVEAYTTNLYARALVRRLVTNIIATGLMLECSPEEGLLGLPEGSLAEWGEHVEIRFSLFGRRADLIDWHRRRTFAGLQRLTLRMAVVAGDCLVVRYRDPVTALPRMRIVDGAAVREPLVGHVPSGHTIRHGVELDPDGRPVAYWIAVATADGMGERFERVEAYDKHGDLQAWLVFGNDQRVDDVRGTPLLAILLQSLKELDKYRDAALRKAVINSLLAMFVTKSEDKPGTRPLTAGARRRDATQVTDGDGTTRQFRAARHIPGLVIDELGVGEEPKAFGNDGTDLNFGKFEEGMLSMMAMCVELPPEIFRLTFSHNYSASQAAINEWKLVLDVRRSNFGEAFCEPIYRDWMITSALRGDVVAEDLLGAWRDPLRYAEFGAWTSAEWAGASKPSTDVFKQARGYQLLIEEGLITRERAAREISGTKAHSNMRKLVRENAQLRLAREALGATDPTPVAASDAPEEPEEDTDDDEEQADG